MSKLHELLAVDQNLKGQAQKTRVELQATIEKKQHLFEEKTVTFFSNQEGVPAQTREQKDIQTTIRREVAWLLPIISKSIDAAYAIDMANTQAKADIVLDDGTTLAKDVPATALLQLEKRIREMLEFAKAIKTLDPAKGFAPDPARDKGIYAAREVTKVSTEKVQEALVLYPATDKHPAQVQLITKDVQKGTIKEQEWSALITPATKSEVLERGEDVLRAVVKARSRANESEIDVKTYKIGKTLLDHIFQPILS
jgi:hypothetical protein